VSAFVDQAILRMDTGRFPRRERPRVEGHAFTQPRQVRLCGTVPGGSYLQISAAGSVSEGGLWIELRDANGERLLRVPVRHLSLDSVPGGASLSVELEAVLVVPGERETGPA